MEYPKFITTNHTFGSTKTTFLTCKNHLLGLQKTLFLNYKNGVFTLRKYGFCFLNVVLLQSVSNIIGRLLAAVGADLSCPHIGIHP